MTTSTQIDPDRVDTTPPSEDELFDVLANSRRRHTIDLLAATQQPHDIGVLSTQIAARENAVDVKAVTSNERKRVYTALQQSHLPKLDAAGFIEFDKQRGTVEPLSALETAEQYLTIARSTKPWSRYYLGLAGGSLVVVVAIWGGIWPVVLLSSLVWTTLIVAAFGAIAAVHRYEHRPETSVW